MMIYQTLLPLFVAPCDKCYAPRQVANNALFSLTMHLSEQKSVTESCFVVIRTIFLKNNQLSYKEYKILFCHLTQKVNTYKTFLISKHRDERNKTMHKVEKQSHMTNGKLQIAMWGGNIFPENFKFSGKFPILCHQCNFW